MCTICSLLTAYAHSYRQIWQDGEPDYFLDVLDALLCGCTCCCSRYLSYWVVHFTVHNCVWPSGWCYTGWITPWWQERILLQRSLKVYWDWNCPRDANSLTVYQHNIWTYFPCFGCKWRSTFWKCSSVLLPFPISSDCYTQPLDSYWEHTKPML